MPAFRLAHISDLHLPPAAPGPWRDLALKRVVSRFAWRRKRHRHDFAGLAAIVADLQAQGPDHIVVTGDLTNFATAEEFAAARDWLQRLAPPTAVTVSPGNHDALVGAGGAERFAGWRPWLGDEGDGRFPFVRRRGPLALVNLCSAVPTAPHLAQGALGGDQLERLGGLLAGLRAEGLCRVLLIHHPPTPGVVSRRKALRDGAELLAVLAAEGAELVLHGHAHAAAVSSLAGPRSAIPVLGIPPASAARAHASGGRWHCLEFDRSGDAWELRMVARGLTQDGGVDELGRYRLRLSSDSASSP